MELGLHGKKVIINGGSRGIGRAALDIYAAEGCDIAFFSRDAKRVDETITQLSKAGVKVFGDALDMNDAAVYEAWLKNAVQRLGGCDIFIHNASSSGAQATTDWDKTFKYKTRNDGTLSETKLIAKLTELSDQADERSIGKHCQKP